MLRISRIGLVHAALALFATALVARAAHVQLWQGARWSARAEAQHVSDAPVPAPRGPILDAGGQTLVESRQLVRLSVAPRQLRNARSARRALEQAGVPRTWASRAADRRRAWVQLPGRFIPTDVATLVAMRGVYAAPATDRVSAASDGLRRLVGSVNGDGVAVDGLELSLDGTLHGTTGTSTVMRDAAGRRFDSPAAPGVPPTRGASVQLTINRSLQDIAERALADAVARMSATGGDIVVLDPHDGAVLAMASRRTDRLSTTTTALTEPFEPGSTLKPFIAAALLSRGRARADETVSTEGGTLTVQGRTITDLHRADRMSLREVIMYSSNVGIVRFAERLTRREEYETLRDLGFGTPTGVPYPSEASGTLRPPRAWSAQSPASLAMGYEIAVTPLQLAAAYAAIANGGELLEPSVVKRIDAPNGDPLYRHERRVVRRVMSPEVAREVRQMLAGVVAKGTAVEADLATFAVAGKSGTARRTEHGRYAKGRYTATFVGLFPADEPQYVILVKLDDPVGAYYGGRTAAPVTRVILEAALAARDAALDRRALASHERRPAAESASAAGIPAEAADPEAIGSVPFVVALAETAPVAAPRRAPSPVPSVDGMPLRSAVHALHRAGFQVRLTAGPQGLTWPASGTIAPPGSVVRLSGGR